MKYGPQASTWIHRSRFYPPSNAVAGQCVLEAAPVAVSIVILAGHIACLSTHNCVSQFQLQIPTQRAYSHTAPLQNRPCRVPSCLCRSSSHPPFDPAAEEDTFCGEAIRQQLESLVAAKSRLTEDNHRWVSIGTAAGVANFRCTQAV